MTGEVVVPDGQSGAWRVESFEVTQQESDFTRVRAMMGRDEFVPAGRYKRLMRGSTVVMSNTPMEIRTNERFMRTATGHVLINGLGLGMVLTEILKKQTVLSVTVVEHSADVITLVAPSFGGDPRVRIVHSDAFTYMPPRGTKFDAVWHDIWDDICQDNLQQMHKLHRKYARRAAWQGSWSRGTLESRR